jgi:hypothetical protein
MNDSSFATIVALANLCPNQVDTKLGGKTTSEPFFRMVFTGSLKKKGEYLPVWKRRYFVLNQLELSYYEHEEDDLLKGVIHLTQTTKIRPYPFSMIENTFQIRDRRVKTEIYLWADSYEMMVLWMNALNGAVQRFKSLNSNTSPIKSLPSSPLRELSEHELSSSSSSLFGSCQCNAIHLLIHSPHPLAQAYCHCHDCQISSSSPFTCLLLFPAHTIEVIKGNVFLGKHQLTYQRFRYFCRQCASFLLFDSSSSFSSSLSSSIHPPAATLSLVPFAANSRPPPPSASSLSSHSSPRKTLPSSSISAFTPSTKYTSVLLGTLSNFPFEPVCHMSYASRVMEMRDGLPKYRGCPVGWGGNDDQPLDSTEEEEEFQLTPSIRASEGVRGEDCSSSTSSESETRGEVWLGADREYKSNRT